MRVALALVLALTATAAAAAAEVEVTREYYEVGGMEPTAIRSELNRRRPKGWDGYTSWYVSWRFRYAPAGGVCRMTSVDTSVKVTYSLPRWNAPREATEATRAAWTRYIAALETHEDGHRDIGVSAANQIDATLRGMSAASCPELSRRANETAYRMLEQAKAREREYDRSTNHGATQGARFP